MDKILFIIPPNISYGNYVNPSFSERIVAKKTGNYGSVVTDMPLGLLSISAYLKKNIKIETKIIDFNIVLNKMDSFKYDSFGALFAEYLSRKDIVDYNPDVIGISTLFTPAYSNMIDVAEVSRKLFSKALILAGGGVPTNMYGDILKTCTAFDAICYGEGEKPMLGLLKSSNKKEYIDKSVSWITKDKAEKETKYQYDFIQDLDDIPFLDYGIINTEDYYINPLLSLFPLAPQDKKSMSVITSRGCPHRCSFCSSHTVHGRQMRYHSIARIREDFRKLKEKYGAEVVVFFDDHLMSDRERVFDIIKTMYDLKLTAFFPSSLALYMLDRKVLEALKGIDTHHLILSVESGSNRVLKEIMHKSLNLDIVSRVISDCRNIGIATDVSILIGLPGETKKDIEDTREYLKTLNATWYRISVATPLLGSEMLDICLKKNYLKGDYMSCDFKRAIVETEDFTTEYIQEKAYLLNLELNFVENSDMKLGDFKTALKEFENVIRVKNDHALAYYFAAKCYDKLNDNGKYGEYKERYNEIIGNSMRWKDYSEQFNLAPLK
ncbi:MAG: B12-binding domain-containing radical SAM protein [Endomicrobiales bacterium]|nr:B12-binding domain-containing radical SAM protein [Endomicrobiales bacterium]